MKQLILLAAGTCLLLGCSAKGPDALAKIPGLAGASEVFTLANLHPDDPRPVLFAANYQRAGLLPVCTRVHILSLSEDTMVFRPEGSAVEYEYGYHPSAVETFPKHLARYFGTSCPRREIDRLSAIDRRNIEDGTVEAGMSRQGVIFAIGYPPPRTTPDLEMDKWRYWRNRFRSFHVEFGKDGRVIRTGYHR